jgi:two-component system, response regulator YesN
MFKINHNRNRKLLVRFAFSYIFILLIPMFLGLQGNKIAVKIVKDDIMRSNLSMLNQAKDIIDSELKQVETLSMQISFNPRVNSLLTLAHPLSDSIYYDFDTTIRELSSYMINRTFIDTFYIYLKSTDYVMTPETLYPSDVYYSRVLKYKDGDFTKWQDMLINNYYTGKYVTPAFSDSDVNNSSNINYIQSLPLSFLQKSQGALIVSFNEEKLLKHFSPVVLDKGGWAYIQDKDGNLITSVSKGNNPSEGLSLEELKNGEDFVQKHIFDNDMIITYTTSAQNGWKYVVVLPSDIVLEKLNDFKLINWIIFGVSALVGIIIAILLAYHNSKPLLNIIKQLKDFIAEDASSADAFSIINGSVSQLITNNKALSEDINSQKPLIQAAFLDKLLRGQIYNETELSGLTSYLGINIYKNKFLVLLLRIYYNDAEEIKFNQEIIQELNVSKAVVRGTVARALGSNAHIHDVDYHTISVLWNFDSIESDSVHDFIENNIKSIKFDLLGSYNMKIHVGGGDIYDNPLEIWQSFEQAEQALNYSLNHKGTITWHNNIPKDSEAYYYPLDLEQRLINHAKVGDFNQAQKLLTIIQEENFKSRNLSPLMSKELIFELKSTVIKLMSQFTDEDTIKKRIKSIDPNNSIESNFELLENIYNKVCDLVLSQKSSQNIELMDKIKRFIQTNYMHQDLSLYKVSSQFSLSEGYFSHLFKEQTGINFTDYLENVRMDHAKDLLKNRDLSINDISEMVGYNSAQSFRRAFKRVCGVNPTALRDN